DAVALQRDHQAAIHVHRRLRLLERPGQRDSDVRVLRLARPVHHAAHHRDLHLLDARTLAPPHGHLLPQILADVHGHLLEARAGGPAAARTARHLPREAPEAERLEDLLGHADLLGAVAARRRGERYADRVPDALLEEDGE